jgi:hypothetical protein
MYSIVRARGPTSRVISFRPRARRFVSSFKGPALSASHRPDLQVSNCFCCRVFRDAQHLFFVGPVQDQNSDCVECKFSGYLCCCAGILPSYAPLLCLKQALERPVLPKSCARPGCSIFARKISNRVSGVNMFLDKGPKKDCRLQINSQTFSSTLVSRGHQDFALMRCVRESCLLRSEENPTRFAASRPASGRSDSLEALVFQGCPVR